MNLERVFLLCTTSYRKLTSGLLLTAIILTNLGFLTVPLHKALAAQVIIDSAVTATQARHAILGASTVFVSDQVGYKFYADNACVYSKTTDGGGSWGTPVTLDSNTSCFGMVVWYDQWTPGDTGDYIHILTADAGAGNDELWYNRLDTTTDTRLLTATPISVVSNTGQGGTLTAGNNNGSITKGTDGTLYIAMSDDGDSYVVECSSNCGVTTGWTETGTNPMDLAADFTLLMPLPAGDILLINRDVSAGADDMRSKVWDDSAGSWSGSWTTIDANAFDNTTYDAAFGAAVDPSTGDIYLAYVDTSNGTLGGNNDDVRTATYSGGAWTNNTDVITNSTRGVTLATVGVDMNTGDIYVGYTGQPTAGNLQPANVYWKRSTDGMATWGGENGPVNTTAEDTYGVDINNANYHRLGISWYGDTSLDVLIEPAMADLVPATEVSTLGIQETEVRASSTDFYIGGTFVITENITSRNVTGITITENGTVDGSTGLDNIELRYDYDTSSPYNCASESYSGSESQFGSTDTTGFSGANGTSTFSGTATTTPTQAMCVYVVMDVLKSASGEIDIEIANPTTDVIVSGGVNAIPYSSQALSGATSVKLGSDFRIQRGVSTISGDTLTITAGTDYDAPSSASSAFIRITNTGYTGAGRDSGGGSSNADDTTVYITNPENITNSVTFQRGTGAINNTRVSWEIIEYQGVAGGENEIIVRQQEDLAYISANTTLTSGAVSGIVDDADVAVFITGQYNANTGTTVYMRGFSTAAWNSGADTVTFTRGTGGNVANVSYAVVEFTGSNWKVQRAEHTYSAAGSTETQGITAVNSLSRTFLHVQKRFTVSTHANQGHEVWLSGIGQLSFLLDAAATTPGGQVAVAWVIENTQTLGTPMDVTRSNGSFNTTGTAPQTNNVSIGKTLPDLSIASIFVNNRSDTALNTWPEPILGVRLISTTQYEIWRSDIAANINYRTEVVEWPTAARKLEQNYYRLYADNNALTPTDPWPAGAADIGENAEMTANDEPTAVGDTVRIRMTVTVTGATEPIGNDAFKLQYALRATTCSAITNWSNLGDIGSTTAAWRGINNTPADGTSLSTDPPTGGDLLISIASVAGTYEEQNNSATNPYVAFPNDEIEYDWVVQHNDPAQDKSSYCFRMVEDDDTVFTAYNFYPVIRTVGYEPLITNWRWYDDETNNTPSTPLGGENVSPSNIVNQNAMKLRLVLQESSGADGVDVKFAVQFSEYADFSQDVYTLTSTSTCVGNSLWCYYDGAGVNNAGINSAVISNADSCVAGVGDGCGTYNESTSTVGATIDQLALTSTEYEFTILHAGARVNAVYYFRLYNMTYDEVVGVADTYSYPSLVTEGAALNSSIGSVASGTLIAGATTDVDTTPSAISFGSVPFSTDWEAAQQITIDTNATEGYQLLVYSSQNLLNTYGEPIAPITATNAVPDAWTDGCLVSAASCFGYHTTDATLAGGSGRFAPTDSYALLDTTPREVMYSSMPTNDSEYMLFRIRVTPDQTAGDYEAEINYIAVPVH